MYFCFLRGLQGPSGRATLHPGEGRSLMAFWPAVQGRASCLSEYRLQNYTKTPERPKLFGSFFERAHTAEAFSDLKHEAAASRR